MPHKCARCGKIHPEDAEYLINGCDVCGSRFFFYVSVENLKKIDDLMKDMKEEEIKEIEKDIRDILGEERKSKSKNDVVVLDLEAIRVVKPGKYLIDVVNLFHQKPLVIRVAPGKYHLDLSTLITRWKKR